MHAGLGKTAESRIGSFGVVNHSGNHYRRRAVFQEIDPVSQGSPFSAEILEEVRNGPCHAMTLGLSGDDHGIKPEQLFDESLIPLRYDISLRSCGHLRSQHRVVFSKRPAAFDSEIRLAVTGDGMKEDRLLHR